MQHAATPSRLLGPWGATDLTTLFRHRLNSPDDGALLGFYQRSSRSHHTEPQQAFLRRAAELGSRLQQGGAEPGTRIAIACSAPEASLLGFCASVLIGAVPAIIPARSAFDDAGLVTRRVEEALALLGEGSRIVLQAKGGRPSLDLPTSGDRITLLDPLEHRSVDPIALDALGAAPPVAPDDISHVQLTSGSTGAGKGIALTHRCLLANCAALKQRLELAPGDVFASWLPLYHDMGLVGQALLGLVHGIDVFLLSPFDFLADPGAWLRTISDRRATVTASPTFGYEHTRTRVTDAEMQRLDLSSWKAACCGAEPVSARVAAAFVERFAAAGLAPTAFTPCYGLAEATLAVTMPPLGAGWRSIRVTRSSLAGLGQVVMTESEGAAGREELDVVALGAPLDGLSVRLVDGNDAPVEQPLVCGEIVLSGSSVAAGTIGGGGRVIPFDDDGLRTGDIGFFQDDELFVVERVKNIVIRNGQNFSGQVLEQTLARVASVDLDDVLVLDVDLATGRGLTAVIEIDRRADPEPIVAAVEAGLDEFDLPPETLVLVRRGLPRTTSGKKRHAAVRELLRTGTLKTLARRELRATTTHFGPEQNGHSSALERGVLALVAEHVRGRGLDVPVLAGSRFVHDLDFDSLAMLELAVAAEDRLDVAVPEESLAELRTVADLITLAERSQRGQSAGERITATLAALERAIPQTYRKVTAQQGRDVLIDGRWIADFASCNYLGLDLHPEVMAAIPEALATWGVHPSWTRAVASPAPYGVLEQRLADLVGAHDAVVFPTVTLLHFGVLPKLAGGRGAIVIDTAAHNSIQEAGALARSRGTAVTTFRHEDMDDLETKLQRLQDRSTRVIAVDGVYSMSGSYANLPALVELAERYDAVLYVDDAHGIGVIGAHPQPGRPYGTGGGGIMRYFGVDRSRIVYVAGLSKAFSSLAAFVTCRDAEERHRFETASTMVFSGPIPVASLASALTGLDVNEREGDARRDRVWALTSRLLAGVRDLGLHADNTTGFPIVNVVLGATETVLAACDVLWEHGVLLTPALFPAAPLDKGGVRFTLTTDNTEAQVDQVLAALAVVRHGASTPRLRAAAG